MPNSVAEQFKKSMPSTVCHHISRLLQCHVYYLNSDNNARCVFAYGQPVSQADDGELLEALFSDEHVKGRPSIKETRPGEIYISIDLYENDKQYGKLSAGPIMGIAKSYDNSQAEQVIDYYENAVSAAILIYHFVYNQWLDEKELLVLFRNDKSKFQGKPRNKKSNYPINKEITHHHSIVYENQFFSLITEGNEKKLLKMMKTPPDGEYGLLDRQHPLRNIKNDCICILTLAARAAISGGVDSETAFSLSDEAIQNLELLRDFDCLYELVEQTLCKFALLVSETKQLNYSYRINRCRNFIINHIYEKLSVASIASHFSLSPEYLSEQFKKETGIRLIDYIQITRAEEAKRLLMYTNKSILDIASLLNYHDQSHFTKSFKGTFGVTPREFRISSCFK